MHWHIYVLLYVHATSPSGRVLSLWMLFFVLFNYVISSGYDFLVQLSIVKQFFVRGMLYYFTNCLITKAKNP